MKIAPIMLTCMLLLSGCSYREFDDRLQSGINDYIQTEPTMPTVINEDGEAVEVTTLQSEWEADINIKYVPVGEQFSDYYAYNDSYGTYDGTEGLSFRVDSVTVYDSVYKSEIPIEEIREYALDNFADRAKFIVADITGKYQNPTDESANNSIICRFMWNSAVRYGADYEYYSKYDDGENANCSDVYALLSYAISFYIKNLFAILFMPFVVTLAVGYMENVLFNRLRSTVTPYEIDPTKFLHSRSIQFFQNSKVILFITVALVAFALGTVFIKGRKNEIY